MGNIVLKNFAIRGAVISLALLLFGMAIFAWGSRELILYYSEPVSTEKLQDSFKDNTRVRLSSYRVAGVFDMNGYSYFVLEYKEGRYCLVETSKDGEFYRRIKVQGKDSISEQRYVIEGYLYHLKDYQLDGVRKALTEQGLDQSQIDKIGGYAVKGLVKDYSLVIFGSLVMILSVVAFFLSRWLSKEQGRMSDIV